MNNENVIRIVNQHDIMTQTGIPPSKQLGMGYIENGVLKVKTSIPIIKNEFDLKKRGLVSGVFSKHGLNPQKYYNDNNPITLKMLKELYQISVANIKLEIKNNEFVQQPTYKRGVPTFDDFVTNSVKQGIKHRTNGSSLNIDLYEGDNERYIAIFDTIGTAAVRLNLSSNFIKKSISKFNNGLDSLIMMDTNTINSLLANAYYGEIADYLQIEFTKIRNKYPHHTKQDGFGQLKLINLKTDFNFHEYVVIDSKQDKWAYFDPTNKMDKHLTNPNDVIHFGNNSMLVKSKYFDFIAKRYTTTNCLLNIKKDDF